MGSKGNERRIQMLPPVCFLINQPMPSTRPITTNERVEAVNKDAKAGIAAAMAFKDVPFRPGKWSYTASAAHYSSESAVSLSLSQNFRKRKICHIRRHFF